MNNDKDKKNIPDPPPRGFDPRLEQTMCIYGPPWMLNGEKPPMEGMIAANDFTMMDFAGLWQCSQCSTLNSGKVCTKCGSAQKKKEEDIKLAEDEWLCICCGAKSTGKFCPECGAVRPWVCEYCGAKNTGKFCTDCGTPKPEV